MLKPPWHLQLTWSRFLIKYPNDAKMRITASSLKRKCRSSGDLSNVSQKYERHVLIGVVCTTTLGDEDAPSDARVSYWPFSSAGDTEGGWAAFSLAVPCPGSLAEAIIVAGCGLPGGLGCSARWLRVVQLDQSGSQRRAARHPLPDIWLFASLVWREWDPRSPISRWYCRDGVLVALRVCLI